MRSTERVAVQIDIFDVQNEKAIMANYGVVAFAFGRGFS